MSETTENGANNGACWKPTGRVMSRDDAARFCAELREAHRTVVFTNGCFDVLHAGHVRYLHDSRRLGAALVIGLNTDASVRRLKGSGRPVQSECDRATILAALACVDAVVLFDEDTPYELIAALKPDVLTKGADYTNKSEVVGWDLVESWGGKVVLIDLLKGRSTTDILARREK